MGDRISSYTGTAQQQLLRYRYRDSRHSVYQNPLTPEDSGRYISSEYKEHCLAVLDPYRLPDAVWVDDTSKIMASSGLFVAIALQKFK